MSIEFWNEGASIVIYAAFEPEVAPLITRCNLRRKSYDRSSNRLST